MKKDITGAAWVTRIIDNPALIEECNLNKLLGSDWANLLKIKPEFKKYKRKN